MEQFIPFEKLSKKKAAPAQLGKAGQLGGYKPGNQKTGKFKSLQQTKGTEVER